MNKVVLVTGASAGIGRALCLSFIDDGFIVYGVARTKAALEETKARALSDKFHYFEADVANYSIMKAVFEEIKKNYGGIDILVNNAAIYPKQNFLDMTSQEWDSVININLNAMANSCRLVLPGMLERKYGRIINVGSLADQAPIKGSSAYSVSKGAVHVLTRAIAEEIDRNLYPDVIVNEFLPKMSRTGMSEEGINPEVAYLTVKSLIDRPSGSDSGKSYMADREVPPNLGLKMLLKHILKDRLTRVLKRIKTIFL